MLLKELSALASPLNDQQIGQLQQAISELSPQQLAWVSGYFWGISQNQPAGAAAPINQAAAAVAAKPAGKLSIIFASQTGNAKGVAEALKEEAQAEGIAVELFDASDYKGKNLAKETHVIVVLLQTVKVKHQIMLWSFMSSYNLRKHRNYRTCNTQ